MRRPAAAKIPWPLLVAVLAFAAYLNSFPNGFALDDVQVVRDNPEIRDPAGIPSLFLKPYWPTGEGRLSGLYRPVTVASFALNRMLTGTGATGYHVTNAALHAVAGLLLLLAAGRWRIPPPAAVLAASLFAVHPVHTEAVANIVGRAELLAAIFVLLASIAHLRAAEAESRPSRAWFLTAAAVLYLLAMLSKEHAVMAPAVFLVHDLLRGRNDGKADRRALPIPAYLAYAAVFAAHLALRAVALGGLHGAANAVFIDNPAAAGGAAVRILTALWIQVRYVLLILWPHPLSSDYSYDVIPVVESAADPRWIAGALLLAAAAAAAIRYRTSRPGVVLAMAIWFGFLLPSSNLPFAVGTMMGERLLYLPSAGACLLAGMLAAGALRGKALFAGTGLVLVAALGAATVARNPDWADNRTLSLADVKNHPRSARLQAGAAIALHDDGELEAAERHYLAALEIFPGHAQMHYNYGLLLAYRGDQAAALDHQRTAAELSPRNPGPPREIAELLERTGRREQSLEHYRTAVNLAPGDFVLRFRFGQALLSLQRTGEAMEQFARLAEDDRHGWPGLLAAVLTREHRGDREGALQACRRLLDRESLPDGVRAHAERIYGILISPPGAPAPGGQPPGAAPRSSRR